MLPHLAHKHSIAPLKKEAGLELLRHLMQMYREGPRALTEEQEQSILGVSGNAGVSPLMLSVICGVLCNKVLANPTWEKDDTTVTTSAIHIRHTLKHG